MNMKEKLRKALPYIASVLFFIVISYAYFTPDIFEGKVLFQNDIQQGIALGEEARAFKEATGETSRWTNSAFSGMPTFQISPSYSSYPIVRFLDHLYSLWMATPASYVFIMLTGFFIFMLAMGVRWHYAVIGAIAYAFSSYFFIIIEAGHIWKFITLAYIPPTLAGIVLAYKGRYWLGGSIAALFAMLQIASNHIQMTYYFLFVIVALVIAYAVILWRQKEMPRFWKASGVLAVAALLAVGANLPNLYHTQKYSKETMRGGHSELTSENKTDGNMSDGLNKDYITQWSYGKMETFSLLIPNVKGGASGMLSSQKAAVDAAPAQVRPYLSQVNSYWGDQPGTSGPVYAGAIICMLFILGCITVKSPVKWALVAATVLSILLSWGKNFMPLTEWFIDYFPMYNKFRTVSSFLVVAEFCMPVLAVLALKQLIENPESSRRPFYIAAGITGGIALVAYIFPGLFGPFTSIYEDQMIGNDSALMQLFAGIEEARKAVFTADALRTLLFVVAASVAIWLYLQKKLSSRWTLLLVGALVLVDMGLVNKRYLNSDCFVESRRMSNPFPMTEADRLILQDPDPNYRVFNLASPSGPFNDARTSYYHKSIGGYHAAKLTRYQDLIDRQLSNMNPEVINMLNTKYYIVPSQDGTTLQVVPNPDALGNAWFVDEVLWVENADAEMKALDTFEATRTAVVDKQFKNQIDEAAVHATPGDTIMLTEYKPNELRYISRTAQPRVAIFSEVYFPWGWQASIDGNPVEIARADYVLRALTVPAGHHEIVFRFEPGSIAVTEGISFASIAIILLSLIGAAVYALAVNKKNNTPSATLGQQTLLRAVKAQKIQK